MISQNDRIHIVLSSKQFDQFNKHLLSKFNLNQTKLIANISKIARFVVDYSKTNLEVNDTSSQDLSNLDMRSILKIRTVLFKYVCDQFCVLCEVKKSRFGIFVNSLNLLDSNDEKKYSLLDLKDNIGELYLENETSAQNYRTGRKIII